MKVDEIHAYYFACNMFAIASSVTQADFSERILLWSLYMYVDCESMSMSIISKDDKKTMVTELTGYFVYSKKWSQDVMNKAVIWWVPFVAWNTSPSIMKYSFTLFVVLFAMFLTHVSANFGYIVSVQMAPGTWSSNGRMDATFYFEDDQGNEVRHEVPLQSFRQVILAGKAYQSTLTAAERIDILKKVKIEWVGSIFDEPKSIHVQSLTIEPAYLLGSERSGKTRHLCSDKNQAQEIPYDDFFYFDTDCKVTIQPIPWGIGQYVFEN